MGAKQRLRTLGFFPKGASAASGTALAGTGTTTSAVANTYLLTTSSGAAPAAGFTYIVQFNSTNTGAATLNINGTGAVSLVKNVSQALQAGDLRASEYFVVVYDGTNFQVLEAGDTASIPAGTAAGTNTYTVTPVPSVSNYVAGAPIIVTFTNGNTGASTLNVGGLGAKTIQKDGQALVAGDIVAGDTMFLVYDGTNYQIIDNVFRPLYAATSGTDTYTASLSPAPAGYTTGMTVELLFGNENTGASTINLNGLGIKTIQRNGAAVVAGDIPANSTWILVYDGTNFQMQNAPTKASSAQINTGSNNSYFITPSGLSGSDYLNTTNTKTVSNKTFGNSNIFTIRDDRFTLQDDGDTTKQMVFQLSGITTATTRTLTIPNASGTITLGTGTLNTVPKWSSANILTDSTITDDGTTTTILTTNITLDSSALILSGSVTVTSYGAWTHKNNFTLQDVTDNTKQMRFDISSIATGTTKVWTFPNATDTFVGTTATQTLTNKTLDNTNTITLKDTLFTLQDDGDTTKQAVFQLSGITTATTRTYTLPDASTTIVGKTGTAAATQIPYYSDANQLTSTTTFIFDSTASFNKIGVGLTPSHPFDATFTSNVSAGLRITNTNSGTAAMSTATFLNNNSELIRMQVSSTGFTTAGLFVASQGRINVSGTVSLLIGTLSASTPIIFHTNGSAAANERARFDANGYWSMLTRTMWNQGADIASAAAITLGGDGNVFEITGTTTIDHIVSTGWKNGAIVVLVFNASLTVNNATATSGANVTILLAGAANFSATVNDTLTLVLSENTAGGQAWREVARTAI